MAGTQVLNLWLWSFAICKLHVSCSGKLVHKLVPHATKSRRKLADKASDLVCTH